MFTRLWHSPVTKGFYGMLLALVFAGLVYRLYQTDQLTRAVVLYIQQHQAPSPPK